MGNEWREKMEHIRSAVQHHVYHEESNWFPKLQQLMPESRQAKLAVRYLEEFNRYTDGGPTAVPLPMAAQIS
jgi:hemerythrin superfamily protein